MKELITEVKCPFIEGRASIRFYTDGTYTSSGMQNHGREAYWKFIKGKLYFKFVLSEEWMTERQAEQTGEILKQHLEFEKEILGKEYGPDEQENSK